MDAIVQSDLLAESAHDVEPDQRSRVRKALAAAVRLPRVRKKYAQGLYECSINCTNVQMHHEPADPVDCKPPPRRADSRPPEGEYYPLLIARELSYAALGHIDWRYQFALGVLVYHLSDTRVKGISNGQNVPGDPAAHDLLVNFIAASIRAALPNSQIDTDRIPRNTHRRKP